LDWAARRLLRHADGLTAVSTGLRREVQASVPGDSRDIQVIHNGVDPDLFTLRPEHQEQQPVILGVGRLSYQKGFDVLIEAFARISAQYPDWELHLAGDGELRSELTRQVLARGVGTKVRFLGMLSAEQLIEALHSVSIVALASRWEGFPVAALEAMSCGNALVTTQNPGTHEMVQDGVNGVLVPRENPQALADALVRLVESPALRHALGLEARETVARRFTWSRAVDDYEALYERLASRAAATGHVGRDANLRP
jgi:glycosyltransferase involved in cell wall biosynthesis